MKKSILSIAMFVGALSFANAQVTTPNPAPTTKISLIKWSMITEQSCRIRIADHQVTVFSNSQTQEAAIDSYFCNRFLRLHSS
jgi:hypothetical protein